MTYYVVAQMGLIFKKISATDYMLETMLIIYYLLIIKLNLIEDVWRIKDNLLLNNKNSSLLLSEKDNIKKFEENTSDKSIQSAGNLTRSSETIRQLSNNFISWFAGIIDGDGNFDIRENYKLKSIRIKLHNRDVRILSHIKNNLGMGRIRQDSRKPYSIYIVSTKKEMKIICNILNGKIRLKVPGFIKACEYLNIEYKEANYNFLPWDPYYSGLIDTDGSIVYNYSSNRIECNLELKQNEFSEKLNFNNLIPGIKPYVIKRSHKNKSQGKVYYSIAFKYQNVVNMIYIYEYFMKNRLYSDFKFYRISKIPKFIEYRNFKKSKNIEEVNIYKSFMLDWVSYKNPKFTRLTYIDKIR